VLFRSVKRSETKLFLYSTAASTPTSSLIPALIALQNARLRLGRLVSAVSDLIQYGPLKPENEQGYTDEEIVTFSSLKNQTTPTPAIVNGKSVLLNPDPTGRRSGTAPSPDMSLVLQKVCENARSLLSDAHIDAGVALTIEAIDEAFGEIRGALMIVWPESLPEWETAREIVEGNEVVEGADSKEVLKDDATIWWASKQILAQKVLSDYIGRNEKTKVIVKIQQAGAGAPVREAPLSENAQKEMMAYYYRKQEESKRLAEDCDDDYLNSTWADGNSLKASFNGIGGVKWKHR